MVDTMSSEPATTKKRILEATWKLLEQGCGQTIKMGDIAKAVGISRQAVYLHFASRTELMIATSNYVDEAKGLNQRLAKLHETKNSIELLEACVEVWANYIPEIYGLAKALLATRDTDEATAAVWDNNMACLREVCAMAIESLQRDDLLDKEWSSEEATDLFWTMLSIYNWEQLTIECGWSQQQYIKHIINVLKQTLLR